VLLSSGVMLCCFTIQVPGVLSSFLVADKVLYVPVSWQPSTWRRE